jgi:hypothetical protein
MEARQHNGRNTDNGTTGEYNGRSKDTDTKEKLAPESISGIK